MNAAVVAAQIRLGNDPARRLRVLAIVDISLISSVRVSSSAILVVSRGFGPARTRRSGENLRDG